MTKSGNPEWSREDFSRTVSLSGLPKDLQMVLEKCMSRAFSPSISFGSITWGFTPGWYETGLWPSTVKWNRPRNQ
ncbi:hypothetical protein GCM10011507_31030 [Edaphobacter acidisoli]|uniref:Uncharacterized protein n=1 Tax=Edaphobacter acidisoli TaxID=2040573 RepID=A0A916W8D8_9BACT|nr:hypothetical protein GCM10011507_31030 [Edaphobacter acidisoli]